MNSDVTSESYTILSPTLVQISVYTSKYTDFEVKNFEMILDTCAKIFDLKITCYAVNALLYIISTVLSWDTVYKYQCT